MSPQELAFILKMHDEATATLKKIGSALRGMGGEAGDAQDDTEELGDSLDRLKRTAVEVTAAVGGIWASMRGVRAANGAWAQYELGLIGVQKTTNMSQAQMAEFRGEFDRLNETMNGIDTAELASMAEAAGQMGVQGTQDIINFTEVMGKLGVTTDIVGNQGAASVGRLLKLTEGSTRNVRAFGDSLNYLGNTTAATEGEILQMATTLATSTAGMNLSTDAILAMAAAAKESGLRDELTGSVFARTLISLKEGSANATEGFRQFLQVANMTKEQFDELARTNPEQVILRFAQAYSALAPTGQGSGLLAALGMDGIEVKRVLGTVGNNIEAFQSRLAALQSGVQEGALDREAENFFGADANKIQAMAKAWEQVKVAVGEALRPLTGPIIEGATAAFLSLAEIIKGLPAPISTAVAAVALLSPGIYGAIKAVALLRVGFLALRGAGLVPMVGTVGALAARLKEAAAAALSFTRASAGAQASIGIFTRLRGVIAGLPGLFANLGGVSRIFGLIRIAVMGVAAAVAALGAVPVAIIAAFVAAGVAIYAYWDEIREFLTKSPKEIVEAIAGWFGSLPEMIADALSSLGQVLVDLFNEALDTLKGVWDAGVEFIFETLPNIDWGKLGRELIDGFTGAVTGALNAAGEAISNWWNSPLWARSEPVTVDVRPQVEPGAVQRALAAGEQTGGMNLGVNIPVPGSKSGKSIVDIARGLRDQIADVQALTGIAKDRVETERLIRDAVEETGVSYAEARRQLGGLISELQRARSEAAVHDLLLDYDDQIASARALTGEQKLQVDIMQQINDLEREFGTITEANRQAIRGKAEELFQVQRASAYQELIRDTNAQLAILGAVTSEERNRLEVVGTILDFERERGRLSDEERQALATKLMQVRQISDFQRLADQYDPVGTARRRYEEELRTLEVMRQQGVITAEVYQRMRQNLDEQTRARRDPIGERTRSLREELFVLRQAVDQQSIERQILQEVNSLRQQGIVVTQGMTDAIRAYAVAMEDYRRASTEGIGGWINEVGTLRENMMGLTGDFASGLSSAISGALAGDRNALRNFAQQLGRKMIETGVNQLMAQAFNGIGFQDPQQKALDRADAALAKLDALNQAGINTPQAIVNAGTVTVNGQLLQQALQNAESSLNAVSAGAVNTNIPSGLFSGPGGQTLQLSPQDIIDLKKTVATEWVRSAGDAQGQGIIDTILNRQATGRWGNTVAEVVNARSQFSDINGPVAWTQGRNSVDDISMSRVSPEVDRLVDDYLARRASGAQSVVGDNLNYANPNYSDRRNLGWISNLQGPTLGRGDAIHRHGTTPELQQYRPGDFNVALPGQQQLQQATAQVQQAGMAMQQAGSQVQMGTAQATTAMQQLNMAQQQTGQASLATGQQFQQAGQQIEQAGAQAGTAAGAAGASDGGFGGLATAMSSVAGASKGGSAGGFASLLPMLFQFLPPPFNMLGGLFGMFGGLFADGGKIKGPGTGTSDSILAAVSNGEFIVNARSTKEWGPLLQAINDNTLPRFAKGGQVGGGNVVPIGERAMTSGRPKGASEEVTALAEQVSDLSKAVGRAVGNGRGRVNNNAVNMTVNARDADSFRRSEGQLLADASLKLNRLGARNN